eukprot:scaffold45196_cov283-Amphora_coffeaeformis.AAC.2
MKEGRHPLSVEGRRNRIARSRTSSTANGHTHQQHSRRKEKSTPYYSRNHIGRCFVDDVKRDQEPGKWMLVWCWYYDDVGKGVACRNECLDNNVVL